MPSNRLLFPAFALAAILFYSVMLFSPRASIHWDLADVSYPVQRSFAESVHAGKLPHWSPYLYSGTPLLSDPGTGAWYPLHWPFYLFGITPRALASELALHAFLALAGAFLLALQLFGEPGPAIVGALFYAFGGFFAAHSSQLAMFEAAALLPWLLWMVLRALDRGSVRWTAAAGLTGGFIVLAGDTAAAIECLLALVLFAAAVRAPWKRTVTVICAVTATAFLLSSVQTWPAILLAAHAVRTDSSASVLHPSTLATLIAADFYNLISGFYTGPEDMRQSYLYSGLLLLPLAAAGFLRREKILLPAALTVPALWFALGPRAGLYALLALFPGLRGSAPAGIWFVAGLGLALAATSGVVWIGHKTGRAHTWIALLVLTVADLWFWNMYKNPLVFAHTSFAQLYGKPSPAFEKALAEAREKPFARIASAAAPLALGPADSPLISHTEVTYGSGLAELTRYAAYMHAAETNTRLLNGLGATAIVTEPRGDLVPNPASLGRVSVPPHVEFVSSRAAALAALLTIDPAEAAVVEAPARTLAPGVTQLRIINYQGDYYRVQYAASAPSLLRIAMPYYPGWIAEIDGRAADLVPVDGALCGVFLTPGEHQLTLQFHSLWFFWGALVSALAALVLTLGLILPSSFGGASNSRCAVR